MLKIKALKPIQSGQGIDTNMSLGDTLKLNRDFKEKIERERADIAQSKIFATPEGP
jgi:hypothetical protein